MFATCSESTAALLLWRGRSRKKKTKKNRLSANQQAAGCSPKLRPHFYSVSRNGTLLVRSWGADWTIAWAIYLTSPLFVPFPFAPACQISSCPFPSLSPRTGKEQRTHFCGSHSRGIAIYPENFLWGTLGMLSSTGHPKIPSPGKGSPWRPVKSTTGERSHQAGIQNLILSPSSGFLSSWASLSNRLWTLFQPKYYFSWRYHVLQKLSTCWAVPAVPFFFYGYLNICFENYPVPTANIKISVTSPYHTAFPVWNSLWSGPQWLLHHFCLFVTFGTAQSYLPAAGCSRRCAAPPPALAVLKY